MLAGAIELNNRAIDRFSAEERRDIGIHTCPGSELRFERIAPMSTTPICCPTCSR